MLEYSETAKIENLFHMYNRLPRVIKVPTVALFCNLKKALADRLKTPTVITFYVTSKCFASCKHCFLSSRLNKDLDNELTPQEIKEIFKSLRHRLTRIAFGGGESFLRDDIVEIYKVIYEINKPVRFWVATPGLYPERIAKLVKEIISAIRRTPFVVSISLEGREQVHDNIIGIKGAYEKAVETLRRLKKIKEQQRHSNFDLRILTTITRDNADDIEGFIDLAKKEFNLVHMFSFMWAANRTCFSIKSDLVSDLNPLDKTLDSLPIRQMRDINRLIDTKLGSKSLLSKIEALKREYVVNIIENKKMVVPCLAHNVNATIFPTGEISVCEFTNPFANLRDYNLDFFKLWNSERAQNIRSQLTNCTCTLPYILSTSFSYDKKSLLRLL